MLTLSNGYLKPQTGDKGSVWFPALEADIQRLNDHNHNGTNSELLDSTSSEAVTQNISSASWAHQGAGLYRQQVTMPAGITYDTHVITLREAVSKSTMYLGVEKTGASTYYVYINDNSLDLIALYT